MPALRRTPRRTDRRTDRWTDRWTDRRSERAARSDTTPRRRTPIPALALGGLLTGALLLVSAPAQAHDELVSTNPADKAQVAVMPATIVLTFEEAAEKVGSQVIVKGPNGNVAVGKPVFSGVTVTQAVQPDAPAGAYTVLWRVTSDDGHPVSGKFAFTAAASAATPTPTPTTAATTSASAVPSAAPTSTPDKESDGSSASSWLKALIVVVLLVPIALFIRRRGELSLRNKED